MIALNVERQDSQKSHNPEGIVEISIIRMLIRVGFHHKRIAALFDCNQGRISEVAKGSYGVPAWWFQIPGTGELSDIGS